MHYLLTTNLHHDSHTKPRDTNNYLPPLQILTTLFR